jgi:predicted transcriptional regulator
MKLKTSIALEEKTLRKLRRLAKAECRTLSSFLDFHIRRLIEEGVQK